MDLCQAVKWRPDNAYRATRCRPAVATPRSSGSPEPMQIELASIGTDLSCAIHRAAPDRLSDYESDFGRGLSEHRFSVTCEVW